MSTKPDSELLLRGRSNPLAALGQTCEQPPTPPWLIRLGYGPALAGVYWQAMTAENCPGGHVLSLLDFTFLAGVDVSDLSTAAGTLFEASIENVRAIPGCVDLKVASQERQVCVLILWEGALSWKSFHESIGFVRMARLVARDIINRSVMVLGVPGFLSRKTKSLWCIETTFEVDLDSDTRLRFESQVSAIVNHLWGGTWEAFTSGWIEHNVSGSIYATEESNAQMWAQCTHIMIYESDGDGSHDQKVSGLVERISRIPMLPDINKKCILRPTMAYHDIPKPPLPESEPMTRPQARTLAGALQSPIRRGALNVKLGDLEAGHAPSYSCLPIGPRPVVQGCLYRPSFPLRFIPFGMVWSRGDVPVEPYMVDVAWLTVRSSLDRIKRRVAKMLDHRVRRLPGYHSGFWVRIVDSAHGFGVFTGIYICHG